MVRGVSIKKHYIHNFVITTLLVCVASASFLRRSERCNQLQKIGVNGLIFFEFTEFGPDIRELCAFRTFSDMPKLFKRRMKGVTSLAAAKGRPSKKSRVRVMQG